MYRIISILTVILCALCANAETVVLYNNNGNGGIHKSTGKLIVVDGQYYVNMAVPSYNGRTTTERLKVYRVKDHAEYVYKQEKWAEKYAFVAERSSGFVSTLYYFNMRSAWRPSLTENRNDPNRVVPIKKLTVYSDDFNGGRNAQKVVLIKTQGKYMLYYGDPYFAANIESNYPPLNYAPAWSRNYNRRAKISGLDVFFNL